MRSFVACRVPGNRPDDPQFWRFRDVRLAGGKRVVHHAARAEAQGHSRRLAQPELQRAALEDPDLGCARVGAERDRHRGGRERVDRLDDRLVLAVDQPTDPLGTVPFELMRTRLERALERCRDPLALLEDPQPDLSRGGEFKAEPDPIRLAVRIG